MTGSRPLLLITVEREHITYCTSHTHTHYHTLLYSYNNQWMVVDYKLFTAGKDLSQKTSDDNAPEW